MRDKIARIIALDTERESLERELRSSLHIKETGEVIVGEYIVTFNMYTPMRVRRADVVL